MKRLLSLAMAFVMVYTLGFCAFVSAASITSAASSPGSAGYMRASYDGATNMPGLNNVDVRAAYDGGVILNPYQTDISDQSSSVSASLNQWGDRVDGQKTKPVITVPIWIRNGAECSIIVGIKDAKVITGNDTITVVSSPITKATNGKQVFLYLDTQVVSGSTASNTPPEIPEFVAYNNSQFVFPAEKNEKTEAVMKIPVAGGGQSNWGAMKICGGVNTEFTDLTMKWEPGDTIDLNYTMKIFPSP